MNNVFSLIILVFITLVSCNNDETSDFIPSKADNGNSVDENGVITSKWFIGDWRNDGTTTIACNRFIPELTDEVLTTYELKMHAKFTGEDGEPVYTMPFVIRDGVNLEHTFTKNNVRLYIETFSTTYNQQNLINFKYEFIPPE